MKDEYPDLREIDRIYEQNFIQAGYKALGLDSNGNQIEVFDEEPFKKALFDLVTSKEADEHTKSDNGWTPGQVYAKLLPDAPGADGTPVETLNLNEQEAYRKHLRRINQLCGSGRTSYVQSHLANEPPDDAGTKRMLCHAKLTRGYDLVDGFYITRDPKLILSDYWDGAVEKWAKAAESLRNSGRMLMSRQPQLGAAMSKSLKASDARVKAALSELINGTAAKAIEEKSSAE